METTPPNRSLLICTTKRSGSSYFCERLERAGCFGRPNEWISAPMLEGRRIAVGLPPETNPVELLLGLAREEVARSGLFASKVLHNDLLDLHGRITASAGPRPSLRDSRATVLDRLGELRLVYLTRRDKAAQAVSHYRADVSGYYHYFGHRPQYELASIAYDFTEILKRWQLRDEQEAEWEALLAESGLPVLRIIFEEFLEDEHGWLERVAAFAGVRFEGIIAEPGFGLRKMGDETARAMASRFEDEHSAFRVQYPERPYPVEPDDAQARLECGESIITRAPFEDFELRMAVTHRGQQEWVTPGLGDWRYWIFLRGRWLDARGGEVVGLPIPEKTLPARVAPGERVELDLSVLAPSEVGDYCLEVDLMQARVRWFGDNGGSEPVRLVVRCRTDGRPRTVEAFVECGARMLDGGRWSPWFGTFWSGDYPYILHDSHGWLYCDGVGRAGHDYRFFDSVLGWWRSDPDTYPGVELAGSGRCLRPVAEGGVGGLRRFQDAITGEVVEVPRSERLPEESIPAWSVGPPGDPP